MNTNLYLQAEWRTVSHYIIQVLGHGGRVEGYDMKRLTMAIACAAAIGTVVADEWTTGQTDPQTGSVDKTGALVYACCSSVGWVDGVMFRAFSEMEGRGDVTLAPASGWDHLTDATYVASSNENFSDEARRLLGGGVYHVKLANQGLSSYTVTLNDLVPGRSYLAQFWVCDARDGDRSGYRLTFDGQATIGYNGNAVKSGQWARCLFTADAATKTFTVVPSVIPAAQLNAFQLRDVSGGTVAWTTAATAGEDDVSVVSDKSAESVVCSGGRLRSHEENAMVQEKSRTKRKSVRYKIFFM